MCARYVSEQTALNSCLFRMSGGEGGGHTGDIPFSILIPACVDAVRGCKSPLTGEQVMVVAAGISHHLFLSRKSFELGSRGYFRWQRSRRGSLVGFASFS